MTDADIIEAMKLAIGPLLIGNHMPDMSGDPLRKATPYERRRIGEAVAAAFAVVQPELDRLRAENARMREALEPFAEAATKGEIGGYPPAYFCGAGDYEKARAALSAPADGEGR